MPRPRKWRRVCMLPHCTRFSPEGRPPGPPVHLAVDEYEAIRLIDLEGLTQEQCADQMAVARTTVQAMYATARKKLADCIVGGRALVIEGGEYRVCEHREGCCGQGCRHRHRGGQAGSAPADVEPEDVESVAQVPRTDAGPKTHHQGEDGHENCSDL
ncbi:MAG: DUF134 domain-containing protein [Clostridiales bacterium]|nr:DUF134 domain-containing protein [Clostridiales bacterium]